MCSRTPDWAWTQKSTQTLDPIKVFGGLGDIVYVHDRRGRNCWQRFRASHATLAAGQSGAQASLMAVDNNERRECWRWWAGATFALSQFNRATQAAAAGGVVVQAVCVHDGDREWGMKPTDHCARMTPTSFYDPELARIRRTTMSPTIKGNDDADRSAFAESRNIPGGGLAAGEQVWDPRR